MKGRIRSYVIRFPLLHKIIRGIYVMILEFMRNKNQFVSLFFRISPIQNNKIVIVNRNGQRFADNPKYVINALIEENRNLDLVWLVNDTSYNKDFPDEIRLVKFGTMKALYELSTSKIWIDNCRKTFYPLKREKQFYIHTGHGSIPLKKVEKDVEEVSVKSSIRASKKDSKMADLMISNSKMRTNLMKNSYWYNGEVAKYGVPKIDILVNGDKSLEKMIYNKYNISQSKNIILYAPTFRYSNNLDIYDIKADVVVDNLSKRFGGKWVFMYRLHPSMLNYADKLDYGENSIEVTNHDDMQELLLASDILITDYSGTMFEYMHTKKPTFIYASDLEEYGTERGLYFDLDRLPFPVAKTNIELKKEILEFDANEYINKVRKFMIEQDIVDNKDASYKLANRIIREIKKGEVQ